MRRTLPPALAALAVFAACLFGLSPSAYWLDSAELGAAAHELGIPHPPGHPLYALTAKVFDLLPLGSIPWRMNLASAVALALAAALLAGLFARVAERVVRWESSAREPLAAGVAVAACLSYSAAFQGVRAEVYALHLALMVGVLALLVRFGEPADDSARREPRLVWLAALVAGLGFANHHFLMLLGALPLALYALWRAGRGVRVRLLGGALAALFLGLSTYVYLPLRAARAPVSSWGDPVVAERFGWVVSAAAFQKSLRPKTESTLGDNALTLVGIAMEALTPLGPPLGLAGLALLLRRRRALGLGLLAATLLTLASQVTMPADPYNPDVHGYLLFAIMLLAGGIYWLVAQLAAAASEQTAGSVALLGGALAVALPVLQVGRTVERWSLSGFHAAEEVTRPLLRDLPQRSVAFTSYFQTVFLAWHARIVLGERPDVALVHRHFLRYPGYAAREGERYPELRSLLGAYAQRSKFPPAAFARLAQERPVAVEWDLDLQPELMSRYAPRGWLGGVDDLEELGRAQDSAAPPGARSALDPPLSVVSNQEISGKAAVSSKKRFSGNAAVPGESANSRLSLRMARSAFWERRYAAAGPGLEEPETRRYFLWKHFLEATAARRLGLRELSAEEARRGLVLSPQSPELRALVADAPSPEPAPGLPEHED